MFLSSNNGGFDGYSFLSGNFMHSKINMESQRGEANGQQVVEDKNGIE